MQKEKPSDQNYLFIHWGENFVEFHTCSNSKQDSQQDLIRYHYNPKSDPKQFGPFRDLLSSTQASEILIDPKFLERYFSFSLGGSVAQVYLDPSLKAQENFFPQRWNTSSGPEKAPALGSSNLEIEMSSMAQAEPSELKLVLEGLKVKGAKRVVLHGRKNSEYEHLFIKMKTLSADLELEVFPREFSLLTSERSYQNLVDACLHGRLSEFHESLTEVIQLTEKKIGVAYLTNAGPRRFPEILASDLIGSTEKTFSQFLEKSEFDYILEFGLEKLAIHTSTKTTSNSANELSLNGLTPTRRVLMTQFLNPVELNMTQVGTLGSEPIPLEPGPMFLGRGQKLTVLDCFIHKAISEADMPFEHSDLCEIFLSKDKELKLRRVETTLKTLAKNSREPHQQAHEFRDKIIQQFFVQLWSELSLILPPRAKGLAVGPLLGLIQRDKMNRSLSTLSLQIPKGRPHFRIPVEWRTP